MSAAKTILVKQTKATTQSSTRQKLTLRAIGTRGVGSTILRKDTRALRGMLNIVQHLISAEQLDEASASKIANKKPTKTKGYKLG